MRDAALDAVDSETERDGQRGEKRSGPSTGNGRVESSVVVYYGSFCDGYDMEAPWEGVRWNGGWRLFCAM